MFLLRDLNYFRKTHSAIKSVFALLGERDDTIRNSVERMILADTNIAPREDFGAALADNNLTWTDLLSGIALDPKILRVGIA
ncbi:MAG: hypothetical protein A2569_00320 [Candidatus Vogelbacteria bacterium RIFOXYD1_FULL_51_18]|uniref:Uncharacterized protein n=1 Tax=Candidatus Vogelbacteria bacterium RIFOXYD1_FULL_51_18 TaxID=1802440 RepID=A0A1G2QL36_9BACT|nr:MAG: hypothetical protein A2569_00320 [Candidatus Vogelbacteria bacterium RIFOXYD1_FULL_51_18]